MTRVARWIWAAVWASIGVFLVWLLFSSMSLSFADVAAAIRSAPLWLLAVVTGLTLLNQIVGTMKWQTAARYLAEPLPSPGFLRLVELTSLGALFGQIIPVQLSTLLARWFLLGREGRASGHAVRATFFEQGFDLILFIGGSVAAVAAIAVGLPPAGALTTLTCVVALMILALRPILGLAAQLILLVGRFALLEAAAKRAADGFSRASRAPTGVLLALAGYSTLRLVLVGFRAVAVFFVFAPETASSLVFISSPGVGLLSALPLTPAGLGIAEWSWSAILIAGGSAPVTAAVAAVNLRLIGIGVVVVIAVSFVLLRHLRGLGGYLMQKKA